MIWSEEETQLMARQEAKLLTQGVKFINQALIKTFPNRTLESIKGKRKSQKYKDMVARLLEEPEVRQEELGFLEEDAVPASNSEANPETEEEDSKGGIATFLSSLPALTTNRFQEHRLQQVVDMISNNGDQDKIMDEISLYLLEVFQTPKEMKTKSSSPKNTHLSKRKMRRMEFAKTQRLWRKNSSWCVKSILEGDRCGDPLPQRLMVPFWRETMTSRENNTPGIKPPQKIHHNLWKPFSITEIIKALPENNTAPGPDGVMAKKWKQVPYQVLVRILNIFLWCGRLPNHLYEARTTLIPKVDKPENPGQFRPITVPSVITRTFNKVLANRMLYTIELDKRQKAFRHVDGCAENVFIMDTVLRYHHKAHKHLYMASIDVAKAFDSVSHAAILDTMKSKGVPIEMVQYIEHLYANSKTRLAYDGWTSEPIKPTCGVKQGDPLSPIIFNSIIDLLIRRLPQDVGTKIDGQKFDVAAFADDIVLMASTPKGLQMMIDASVDFLRQCGLRINPDKSLTIALQNVPHEKKTAVKTDIKFTCNGRQIKACKRTDEWTYLGVSFTAEGKALKDSKKELDEVLQKITKAPLKPQQRLFSLRVFILPAQFHKLVLGNTRTSLLNRIDMKIRSYIRKWLSLPHDTPKAYFHAEVRDGGLGIPSLRWSIPMMRLNRLEHLKSSGEIDITSYIDKEILRTKGTLNDNGQNLGKAEDIKKRWASLLYQSVDGKALKDSADVPQQHQWLRDGTKYLSGRDFINFNRLRINAMPVKSRTSRGRNYDRMCRAGCNNSETLNHVLQGCHRSHDTRIKRHNAVVSYIARNLKNQKYEVHEEPHLITPEGVRKPDIIAVKDQDAIVIDAQVVAEQADLKRAHEKKIGYYEPLKEEIKKKYKVRNVQMTSATLSLRGIWGRESCNILLGLHVLKKSELKNLSTRVLRGGIICFNAFMKRTAIRPRRGRRRGRPPNQRITGAQGRLA